MPSLLILQMRHAARGLRRNPTFATAVLLTLALAIGANTAVFTVVNGVLLNPLPYPEPDRLVNVVTRAPGAPGVNGGIADMPESASMYVTYAEGNRSFEHLGVSDRFPLTITVAQTSEQVRAIGVTQGVLDALRVPPLLGRPFAPADYRVDGARTVMLGWGYWQRRFGGDPSVVGRTITNDSRQLTVVGVMPRGFRIVSDDPEVLVPQAFDRSRLVLVYFQYEMVGRLKPGVSLAQADADLSRLTYLWGGSWPMPPGYQGGGARPFDSWRFESVTRPLKDSVVESVAGILWVLMATIGIVMLIACANVANLVLVRSAGRQQEFAVRMALGAGRGRLLAEWLAESVTLGVVGGTVGLALAYGGVRLLQAYGPDRFPRLQEIGIDARVLAFALLVSVASGMLFGVIPAFKYAAGRLSEMLAGGRGASDGRGRARTRNGLVIAQVALALVLLVSAGLMMRTFLAMRGIAPGFDTDGVQTVRVIVPPAAASTADQVWQMQKTLLQAFGAIPGVTATALTTSLAMESLGPTPIGSPQFPVFSERDTPEVSRKRPLRPFKYVSPDFFRASGTRMVAGREYSWSDLDALRPVAIVSRSLAVDLWGSPEAALGQRVRPDPNASWRQVIGVAEDVRDNGAHRPPPAIAYWPARMEGANAAVPAQVSRGVAFVIRSPRAGDPALIDALRRQVASASAGIPVTIVRTMGEIYEASMAQTSFVLVMLAIAALMALTLGLIGIYGVVAYAVARRTREVGVRMALGAPQRELLRMFLMQALLLTGIGIGIGVAAAAGLTRALASLLFEVRPVDPLTYAAVALLLTAATLLASYLPARRASNLNPVAALRAE